MAANLRTDTHLNLVNQPATPPPLFYPTLDEISLSLCRQGLCCIPDEMSELSLRAFHYACVCVCVNAHSTAASVFIPVPRSVCMHMQALVLYLSDTERERVNEPVARVYVCV